MKYDLDRTSMKKIDKNSKSCMHWNVALDALPVSARLVRVLDRWLNDCRVEYWLSSSFH